ncbi:MAG: TlpA family protein disulfide reductase [Gammaproteobacteria bacterium]|nr:TlpA family protein disulfide reductase [Gammaproteobacteria bacterium]
MNRNGLILAAIALVSALGGVLLYDYLQPGSAKTPATSSQAPLELSAVPLTDLEDRHTVFNDWKGDILLVNFWAPWCAPCRREIPSLIQVQNEYAERGVRILGIAFDSKPQVQEFATEYGINYPLFLSANRTAMYGAALGNPSGSLPYTVLLDRNLQIIYQHNGEVSLQALRTQLEKAL